MNAKAAVGVLALALVTTGCTTSLHGSYAPISYVAEESVRKTEALGRVQGTSCQTRMLYLFPAGPGVSTSEAIQSAKNELAGTSYIADISIDDRMNWQFGYSEHCINVDAVAY